MGSPCHRLNRFAALGIAIVLVMAVHSIATATEMRVSWDRCGPERVPNRDFGCATNAGVDTLSVSIIPDFNFPQVALVSVAMGICSHEMVYPDWWHVLRPGDCRLGSMSAIPAGPGGGCPSAWDPGGGSSTSIRWAQDNVRNGVAFRLDASIGDSTRARDLVAGQEYEIARLVLDHAGTVGAGACAGCEIAENVAAEYVWLYTTDGRGTGSGVFGPAATWQDPDMICRTVSPVRNATWGRIKSLYR